MNGTFELGEHLEAPGVKSTTNDLALSVKGTFASGAIRNVNEGNKCGTDAVAMKPGSVEYTIVEGAEAGRKDTSTIRIAK